MSRLLRVLLALLMLTPVLAASGQEADAQNDLHSEAVPSSYTDEELLDALRSADLVVQWLAAGDVSQQAALVTVTGAGDYATARQAILVALARHAERGAKMEQRQAQVRALAADLDVLQRVTRQLRREVVANHTERLPNDTIDDALYTLEQLGARDLRLGLSLDPLVLTGYGLAQVRDDVLEQVDRLTQDPEAVALATTNKSLDTVVDEFSDINADLGRIDALLERTVELSLADNFAFHGERTSIIESMGAIHELRKLSPTVVGGLSVVTLDAYVRGAETLNPSCPVDWAMLAGIGRVESRHGTIDNTTVLGSGLVSAPILGPLLDGGATEREAAEAALAEITAAEAAEAQRIADLEAEAAAEAAELAALAALVWGEQGAEQRAEELERMETAAPAVGLAATPEPEIEEVAPLFSPLLWGDDLPFDEDDLLPLDDEQQAELDEDEAEFKGNGFAVIVDSDNGTLDGNSRWDRAVGPMQFIPETWSYWAVDGNDDGAADPQNLYDAAATAGEFLCYLSETRGASPSSFILGYNASRSYVLNVLAVADAFAVQDFVAHDFAAPELPHDAALSGAYD